MTTIAYRDGVLAADTRMTLHDQIEGRQVKVVKRGRVLAAASGTAAMCRDFRSWVSAGCIGAPPPTPSANNPDLSYWGFIATPDACFLINDAGLIRLDVPYYAMGSGGEFAAGAMAVGATAEEAVRAAMTLDCKSGGDVVSVRH
ncbi:hypothetical protein [Brevundimonas sp.]|uniref:hypothetical protein n=1 Tax=Brevundimonas sp. TaxID=1871086 RepID=UPI0025B91F6F|nr:hypothetical protein [Brevundimonas sp.]